MDKNPKKVKDPLKVLFPEEEVELRDGSVLKVRPLSLSNMPKVVDAFGVVLKYAEQGTSASEVATQAMSELMKLVPFCIDRDPEEIPIDSVPEILEIIVSQNINETVLGKWKALVQKVGKLQASVKMDQSIPLKKS